jgi:GNAT superfamily N-acetyltransferase
MRRVSFADAASADGSAALNRVFENYLIPIAFTPEQLDLHVLYNDIDLRQSPLWYDDEGRVVAAALVGVRESRAWIGGFGVAPEHRGLGYAKRLLEQIIVSARARGLTSIALEVLRENAPAIALYRGGGFREMRELRSFQTTLVEPSLPGGYSAIDPDRIVDEPESARPCWQRERATLRNGAVSGAVQDRHGNFAAYRSNANLAQLMKLRAAGPEELNALANAVGAERSVRSVLLLNEPAESAIARHAETAGWSRPFDQFEMLMPL